MDVTAEGIGERKWSFDEEGLELRQGASCLATLNPSVAEPVKHLLVTAPQLWAAANEVCHLEYVVVDEGKPENFTEMAEAMERLRNMVAKAVGKQDWKDVLQG